jgi:hypothetical protein
MGDLTRAQLLAQSGLSAGNDQADSYVATWLDAWLKRTAKSWSWPGLKKRVSDLAIAQGSASVACGYGTSTKVAGTTLSTHHIHRLIGGVVFWYVPTSFNPHGRAFVRPLLGADPDNDESASDPATRQGTPSTVKVRQSADGALTLYPDPVPDRALYLAFDAHIIPPSLASSSEIPWYPNDKTLLQAVKVALLELDAAGEKDPHFDDEGMKLAAMVVDDRDFDGEQAGDNQMMLLDPSVFL